MPVPLAFKKLAFSNIELYRMARKITYFDYRWKISGQEAKSKGSNIIVCGVARSGSTLIYNILLELLAKRDICNYGFFRNEYEYKEYILSQDMITVAKTHRYSPLLEKKISSGIDIGIFTHRSLLDVIASLIQKKWIADVTTFLSSDNYKSLVNDAILYSRIENMTVVSYEELYRYKEKVIKRLAAVLEVAVSQADLTKISSKTSVDATHRKIEAMNYSLVGNNYVNKNTGLHKGHINDPSLGKYHQVLTLNDVKKIKNDVFYKKYSTSFGYM